jgi:RHS repeat-associated protein
LGRQATVSNPYRTSNDPGPTNGITTSNYDALGRVTKLIPPDGTASTDNLTTTYAGNCATVTDQANKIRKSCTDGLGRLTQVFEPDSSNNLVNETDYQYDALNNLLTVNQKGNTTDSTKWRARTFTYNSLSQLLTATNPESGTITYTYDSDGNVQTKLDARSITITYAYDVLNRLTGKTYSNGDPAISYFYDQASYNGLTIANGIGRRTGMTNAAGSEAWSYDAMGRALTDQRTTNGIAKSTLYTYNFDASLASLTYPSGRVITYTLASSGSNTAGRFASAVDTPYSINYATAAHYAPQGALTSLTNGANLSSTYLYNSRLQPCWMYATTGTALPWNSPSVNCTSPDPGPGSVLDLQYNFSLGVADNGNVMGITNKRDTTRTQNFAFDTLNRIAAANTQATTGTNAWGLQFGYDVWGNLLSASTTQGNPPNLCVNASTSNRLTTTCTGLTTFSYDAAGNMLYDGSYNYTFNGEGEMNSAAGATYTYDGDGKRVQKSSGKLYWYGMGSDPLDETDATGATNNASFNEYIFFAGKRVARRDSSSNVFYYFADHLGTSRDIVQAGQSSPCYDADFYPFGGERVITNTCPQNYKFTSKERDAESNLDNFGARYNSSNLGRFMSPDPSPNGVAMGDPQSWNLYSYARNRPTRFVDVGGNWATDVHAEITTFALQGYVSAGELKQLVAEQYVMDRDQSPEHQFMHAMSNGQSSPPQSPGDASDQMWNFVAVSVAGSNATLGSDGSFTSVSLEWLGQAIHTLQDHTSPMHTSASGEPLPWRGMGIHFVGAIGHWAGESSADRDWSAIGLAVRLTMAAYMEANPNLAARHGLTAATFDQQANQRISECVNWFYSQSVNNNEPHWKEEAARQCAFGNPAACN